MRAVVQEQLRCTGAARRGRWFYRAMGLVALGLVIWGFSGTYFRPMLVDGRSFDTVIHIHAAVFAGWVLFFIFQASLAAGGRLAWHRSWGWVGAALAVAVLVVGFFVTLNGLARGIAADRLEAAQRFTIIPLTDLVLFGAFVGLAVLNRARGETHKRLMLLATLTLVPAAVARLTFPHFGETLAPVTVVMAVVVLAAVVYDLYSRDRPHPVYLVGGTVLVASLPVRHLILGTDTWQSISALLVPLAPTGG